MAFRKPRVNKNLRPEYTKGRSKDQERRLVENQMNTKPVRLVPYSPPTKPDFKSRAANDDTWD